MIFLNVPSPVEQYSNSKVMIYYSFAFSYSMFFTNFSLNFISFPTQALAKSCKILPAMIGSLFVKNLHYHPLQYLSVVMITTGTIIFNYSNKKSGNDSVFGLALLGLSLAMDSLTSYYQEHIRRTYRPSSLQTMKTCCGWGAVLLIPSLLFLTVFVREKSLIEYLIKYPDVMIDILLFCICSATGQAFIFWGLKAFGTLSLVIITTIRKFMAVILSIVMYSHAISSQQILCMFLVFSGAGIDIFVSNFMSEPKLKH